MDTDEARLVVAVLILRIAGRLCIDSESSTLSLSSSSSSVSVSTTVGVADPLSLPL
jgi:hypothetical protein